MKFNIVKSKEFRNMSWLVGEQIFQMLLSLIVGSLSARYLGPDNYGELNYTASFVTFFMAIATLEMGGVCIKKLIAEPEREGVYLGSCMFFRFVSSLLSIASVVILVAIINPGEKIKVILVFLQSLQLLFRAVFILDSWFQRYLKSRYMSIGKMVASVIVSIYKLYLLITSKSIIWFAFSTSLTDLIIAIMLYVFYKRETSQALKVDFKAGFDVLKDSYHFIISSLMTAIYTQMDKIMIGRMIGDTDVGLYTTATTVSGLWLFVQIAIVNSMRPKIMELKQSGNEASYIKRLQQLYSLVIWSCVLFSVLISILAKPIIFVLYGEAYYGAINALRIVIWCETFAMIGTARGIWILCEGKNKYVKNYLLIGAVVNLIMNIVFIPLYGIEGAAVATLITQFIASIVAPVLFKETRIHTKIVLEAFILKWFWNKEKGQHL